MQHMGAMMACDLLNIVSAEYIVKGAGFKEPEVGEGTPLAFDMGQTFCINAELNKLEGLKIKQIRPAFLDEHIFSHGYATEFLDLQCVLNGGETL